MPPKRTQRIDGTRPSALDREGRRRSDGKDALASLLTSLNNLNLSGLVEKGDPVKGAHGGYCDVFHGSMRSASPATMSGELNCILVAIKRLRVHILLERDFAKVT